MYCFLGVLVGNLVGVLPGMGPVATISILLPLTFGMPPVPAILMLSGVYYGINVLPVWLQAVAHLSPATYMLRGIRAGVIDGSGFHAEASTLGWLLLFGVVMVPGSIFAFTSAERWAKRTGRLKRQG